MGKYRFIRLEYSGEYLIYKEDINFHKYVKTREEAQDLRDKLNRDAECVKGDGK